MVVSYWFHVHFPQICPPEQSEAVRTNITIVSFPTEISTGSNTFGFLSVWKSLKTFTCLLVAIAMTVLRYRVVRNPRK